MKYLIALLFVTSIMAEDVKITVLKFDDESTFEVLNFFTVQIDGKPVCKFTTTEGVKASKEGTVVDKEVKMVDRDKLPDATKSLLTVYEANVKHRERKDGEDIDKLNNKELEAQRKGIVVRLTMLLNKFKTIKQKQKDARNTSDALSLKEEDFIHAKALEDAKVNGLDRVTRGERGDFQKRCDDMQVKILETRRQRLQLQYDNRNAEEDLQQMRKEFVELSSDLEDMDTAMSKMGISFQKIKFSIGE